MNSHFIYKELKLYRKFRDKSHEVEEIILYMRNGPEIWFVSKVFQASDWNNDRVLWRGITALRNKEQANFEKAYIKN